MLKKNIFLTIFIFSLSFISAEEALFSFSAGISSGGVIYSDPEVKSINTKIGTPTPCNIGASFYVNHNPVQEISFFIGTDFFFCTSAKNQQSYNHLFLNIPFGIKIYPKLKGFCISSAYIPGFRKDFINVAELPDVKEKVFPFSNGFKFSLEYNFAHGKQSKYLPTVGTAWTHMPRGNYHKDNFLTAFIHINF